MYLGRRVAVNMRDRFAHKIINWVLILMDDRLRLLGIISVRQYADPCNSTHTQHDQILLIIL